MGPPERFSLIFTGHSDRNWEVQSGNGDISVAGNIHKKGRFWRETLKASKFVTNIINDGYRLPFIEFCPPFAAKNNASSLKHPEFVSEAIQKLLDANCVKEVDNIPHCCNPLTVAGKEKLRLVLDLRHVNEYLRHCKFRYENLKTLEKIFDREFYFANFDLKSGYHHISINEADFQYLGFAWDFNGTLRYFVFLVIPFGLSTASYVFTKMVRPLVKKWRGGGIRCVVYIDDGIFGSPRKLVTAYACLQIRDDLENAGFTINEEKSHLYPTQVGRWLGFIIDTVDFQFKVPEDKLSKLITLLAIEVRQEKTSARKIAKIAGNIIAMGPAIGPLTRLFTRQMYSFIDRTFTWDGSEILSQHVLEELQFWLENVDAVNGYHIKEMHAYTKIVYTDASGHGFGGYVAEKLGNIIAQGNFSFAEKGTSSTFRELLAVKQVLLSLTKYLQHQVVLWHSDNINVSRILEVGSPKENLQVLALEIFRICLQYDVTILPVWLPREENKLADAISKHVDTDDWSIDHESFVYIQKRFGKLDTDRFASNTNRRLRRFDARFHCPECETVNTFTANWANCFNWLCPPISLIGAALKHLKLCTGRGVLMVPEWQSAYYWPLLTPDGKVFYPFVQDFLLLDPYYSNNSDVQSVFNGFAKFRSLALLIRF